MNCEQIKDLLLTDHLDGELGTEEMTAVQRHLDACPACRAYQVSVRTAAVGPFASLAPLQPPATLWQRIITVIRAESPGVREPLPTSPGNPTSTGPQRQPLFKLLPGMVMIGFLLILAYLWFGTPAPSGSPSRLAFQRQLTPEEWLFGSDVAAERRMLRGMRLDTAMEKLFL